MINRLKIALEDDEFTALVKVALAELRNPSDQARHILRTELERRGLLPETSIESDADHVKREPSHA